VRRRHRWPGGGRPGRRRRRPAGLLRCSLRQDQGRGDEKQGNGQTREHDNLIDMNLPLLVMNTGQDSLMLDQACVDIARLDKHQ
jgi:hypothetical protein